MSADSNIAWQIHVFATFAINYRHGITPSFVASSVLIEVGDFSLDVVKN